MQMNRFHLEDCRRRRVCDLIVELSNTATAFRGHRSRHEYPVQYGFYGFDKLVRLWTNRPRDVWNVQVRECSRNVLNKSYAGCVYEIE